MGPRTSHVVAGAVGAVIGGVLAPVSSGAVGVAAGGVAGGEVAEAVENRGLICAGPYGIRPLTESEALWRIADLAWSK